MGDKEIQDTYAALNYLDTAGDKYPLDKNTMSLCLR